MSHEILLLAGPEGSAARERRLKVVQHAAELVPGATAHRILDTTAASIAVVETAPGGGSAVSITEAGDSVTVVLATNTSGLDVVTDDLLSGRAAGSEAGHVAVRVTPNGAVVVSTDGMASVPSFWGEHVGHLFFASHLASLVSLGLPADVDERGVSEYLTMLHPLQDRTTLRAARLLRPGEALTWHEGSTRRSEQPVFLPGDASMTDDEAIARYRELWTAVTSDVFDRHADARVSVGLSGGLDSRSVAAGAVMAGHRPFTFSYGSHRNIETRTAGAVALRLGLPHAVLPVTDDYLMPDPERSVGRLDGAHSPAEMYELWFSDVLRPITDVLVNGAGGGPLWGDEKTLGMTNADAVGAQIWSRYAGAAAAAEPYLAPSARSDAAREARSGIQTSLTDWDLSARADMTVFWRVANRQVRWGNMLTSAVRRSGIQIETPFLDARFLRFAANLSPSQRMNGRLHLRAQREVFAATADIGRSDDGNSPQRLNHVYWSGESTYLSQLSTLTRRHPGSGVRRATRRVADVGAGVLRRYPPLTGPANWWQERRSVFAVDLWGRTRAPFAERLAALIEAHDTVHPMFDERALSTAAAELRAGRFAGSASALARVATANAWLVDYAARERARAG